MYETLIYNTVTGEEEIVYSHRNDLNQQIEGLGWRVEDTVIRRREYID